MVDGERLDLVEVRCRTRARRVAPVDAAEGRDVDRRLSLLHHTDLPRGGVRPQQRVGVHVERVAVRPRRMRQRLVERIEVVPDRLDFAAVDDLVAEPEEDILHLAPDLRERMKPPAAESRSRQRDVERLVERGQLFALKRGLALVERRLEALADGVERPARLAVSYLTQSLLQVALAPEVADADLVELLGARRGGHRGFRLAL